MYLFVSFLHYKNSGLSFPVSLSSTSASNSEGRRMNTLGSTIIKKINTQEIKYNMNI